MTLLAHARILIPCAVVCLHQVRSAFTTAGANATWLPSAQTLGVVAVNYNLAEWNGNTTAYLTCNLNIRGPEYLGTCADMPVACVATTVDAQPYNCSRLSNGLTVAGNISNAGYRWVSGAVT